MELNISSLRLMLIWTNVTLIYLVFAMESLSADELLVEYTTANIIVHAGLYFEYPIHLEDRPYLLIQEV